ncbi:hypothetical protein KSP39_PZI005534 [Platanthera zijinensis]|uniref:Uncharacterized protein n=1 Tax=Platanthera zijinensis TaxID=2320716 RepID=A0AAP0BTC6_9ASPA
MTTNPNRWPLHSGVRHHQAVPLLHRWRDRCFLHLDHNALRSSIRQFSASYPLSIVANLAQDCHFAVMGDMLDVSSSGCLTDPPAEPAYFDEDAKCLILFLRRLATAKLVNNGEISA